MIKCLLGTLMFFGLKENCPFLVKLWTIQGILGCPRNAHLFSWFCLSKTWDEPWDQLNEVTDFLTQVFQVQVSISS